MAKIQIKSEKITPFGGFFPIMDSFDRVLSGVVDSTLGLRSKLIGYQYSDIIRSLMCVYFCGGSCIVTTLMLRFSRPTSDDTDNLWPPYCVLPQVALWRKGILCLLVEIFTSLSLFF